MDKVVSNFYLVRLDGSPVYVGYTNRSIKTRFKEHLKDKDFGDGEVTLEGLGELSYAFTWDTELINQYANEVRDRESELVYQYGTQDGQWQKGTSESIGGQTWANVKYFVKTNKDNPKFSGMHKGEILEYLDTSYRVSGYLKALVDNMDDPVSIYLKNFVNHMNDPIAIYMNNFMSHMDDPVAIYMRGFVGSMDNPMSIYMKNFVKRMNDPVATYMNNFVNRMDDFVAAYMKDFVGNMDYPVATYMKDFVSNMNDPISIYIGGFVNGMGDSVSIYMKNFVKHMDDPVSIYIGHFVSNMKSP